MKRYKITASVLIIITMLFSMCGCSFRFSSFDDLVRPPKLSGKYQGLQDAFEKTVKAGFSLLTPENGEYQSAFVTFDADSDLEEEALVFYTEKEQDDTAKFCYFEYNNNEWLHVTTQDGLGNAIDKVIISDINSDGFCEIVIGWNLFSSKTNKAFAAYSVESNKLTPISSFNYTYLDVIDVNGDGLNDILTLTVDSSVPDHLTASAKFYNYNSQKSLLTVMGQTPLDGNISSYSSVKVETVGDTNLIYIEANKGQNDTITELIYWDDSTNALVSPLFDIVSQSTISTWRNIPVYAYDIDGDKLLEIPTSVEMSGSSVTTTDALKATATLTSDEIASTPVYFTKWVKWTNSRLKPVQYSVVNTSIGYILNIKSSWVGRITVTGLDGQWDFYRWNASDSGMGDLLFSIYSYEKGDVEQKKQFDGYEELAVGTDKTYVYQITQAGKAFGVNENTLKDNFVIYNFGGQK